MTEPEANKETISNELKQLGQNFKTVLNAFWESEERKSATRQFEQGAAEIGKAFDKFAEDVTTSEVSKRLQNEVGDIQKRIQSGEMEEKVRSDVLHTLRRVNQELDQFTQRWSGSTEEQPAGESGQVSDTEEGV